MDKLVRQVLMQFIVVFIDIFRIFLIAIMLHVCEMMGNSGFLDMSKRIHAGICFHI